jgi:hypothetical protein
MDGVVTNLARHYGVREFNFWSPLLGADAVRVSMVDENGEEFFAIIEKTEGLRWRNDKREACEMLDQAIRAGLRPGEIRWKK